MNEEKIEELFKEVLKEIGIEEGSEVSRNTPKRIAKAYKEIFAGMNDGNEPSITVFDNPGYSDILAVKDVPFYSMCEHHLLPFFGTVSIAYIPGQKILGLSKFPRITRFFSAKPQVQEKLTKEIADYIAEKVEAKGVLVVIKARHLCMEMRGIKARKAETRSSAIRGVFKDNAETREEALKLLLED